MGVAVHPAGHARLDVELHNGAAVLQRDTADLPHLHAGDVHRLALPGRHRLRVLELGEDPRLVLPREAQALVHAHVEGDRRCQADHPGQRQQVLQVLLCDLSQVGHGYPSAGPVSAWRFGRFCFAHGACGFNGGWTFVNRGREPSSLFSVIPTSCWPSAGIVPVRNV